MSGELIYGATKVVIYVNGEEFKRYENTKQEDTVEVVVDK